MKGRWHVRASGGHWLDVGMSSMGLALGTACCATATLANALASWQWQYTTLAEGMPEKRIAFVDVGLESILATPQPAVAASALKTWESSEEGLSQANTQGGLCDKLHKTSHDTLERLCS